MKRVCQLFLAVVGLVACGQKPAPQDGGLVVNCQHDSRVTPYAPNMFQASADGQAKIILVESNPAPPGLNTNTWTLKVTDANGTSQPGLNLSVAVPYMPDHQHPSDQTPWITTNSDGTYTVNDVYFFMMGVWRTTFTVPEGANNEQVQFFFCVEG